MIKRIATCPYCGRGDVAYDCETMELTFNPDSVPQQACTHLLCISGTYCGTEVLPDGSRRFGMARLDWRDPELAGVPVGDVVRCAEELASHGTEDGGQAALQLEHVRLDMARQLSRRELARWLDQVGWDTDDSDWPSAEQSLHGLVIFAHNRDPLLSRVAGQRKAS